MRRAEFLALTGLTVPQHRGMVKNDQLPFIEDDEGKWTDYSVRHVFLTSLALVLGPSVGGLSEASRRVVELSQAQWSGHFRLLLADDLEDVYAASYATSPTHRGWAIDRIQNLLSDPDLRSHRVRFISVVNLSAIARDMRDRAEAAGITLSPELDVEAHG